MRGLRARTIAEGASSWVGIAYFTEPSAPASVVGFHFVDLTNALALYESSSEVPRDVVDTFFPTSSLVFWSQELDAFKASRSVGMSFAYLCAVNFRLGMRTGKCSLLEQQERSKKDLSQSLVAMDRVSCSTRCSSKSGATIVTVETTF